MFQVSQDFLRLHSSNENNATQRVNFSLHKDCNLNCEYCYQKDTFDRKHITDEEIFNNFEYCLNKLENISSELLRP